MKCLLCPRLAWYQTPGTSRYYCGQHEAEAKEDTKLTGVKSNRPKEVA